MKKQIIHRDNIGPRPPLNFTWLTLLTLHITGSNDWLWGAGCAILLFAWVSYLTRLVSSEYVDIFELEDDEE